MTEVDGGSSTSPLAARQRVAGGLADPSELRAVFAAVPPGERDAWLDSFLGLDGVPDDGPDLPAGCVPYLPCSANTLLRLVDLAGISASDVFVDIGAGVGRAAALIHLLTGASAIGIEAQAELVRAARALALALGLDAPRLSILHGDAAVLTRTMTMGTVFFLYCPFSGERLRSVLDDIEGIARTRTLRVCFVDLPLPPLSWLKEVISFDGVVLYRSTHKEP